MRVLGINAIFHDPAAALIVDGQIVAAAEEERFSRRKHGKRPVPFSAWELPEKSAAWCLESGRAAPDDLDAVAYSYDPGASAGPPTRSASTTPGTTCGSVTPGRRRSSWPRRCPALTRPPSTTSATTRRTPPRPAWRPRSATPACWSATGAARPPRTWPGTTPAGKLEVLASQSLPHSLGLFYEQATAHLGFLHSSDEYKVMALASYGTPRFAAELRTPGVRRRRRAASAPSRWTGTGWSNGARRASR